MLGGMPAPPMELLLHLFICRTQYGISLWSSDPLMTKSTASPDLSITSLVKIIAILDPYNIL